MKATANNIQAVVNEVEKAKTRSVWARGVQFYAGMLLERFEEWAKFNEANGEDVPELDEATALNGASDWSV